MKIKRFLACIMAALMCISCLPVNVRADDVVHVQEDEHEHVWDSGEETTAPTCTEPGVMTYTCTGCGETRTEEIPATGHSWLYSYSQDAGCEDGWIVYQCGNCYEEKKETIPGRGHDWDEGKITKEATSYDYGELTYTCTVCYKTRTEQIEKYPEEDEIVHSGICGDDLTWTLNADGVLRISGTGEMYNETPWYSLRDSITSVIVDEGVTSLGNYAFNSLEKSFSVSIPSTILRIGNDLFYRYGSYTYSVQINMSACEYWNRFSQSENKFEDNSHVVITFASDHPGFHTEIEQEPDGENYGIVRSVCDECGAYYSLSYYNENGSVSIGKLLEVNGLSDFDLVVPQTIGGLQVRKINRGAFSVNIASKIRSAYIPDGVTELERELFYYHPVNLVSVRLPEGITSIPDSTFWGCTSLSEVTIPSTVTTISGSSFGSCSSLTEIVISENVTTIGYQAFWGCTSLEQVTIDSTELKTIDSYAFRKCTSLSEFVIPDGVEIIGSCAFADCAMTEITVPSSVKNIYDYALGMKSVSDSSNTFVQIPGFIIYGYPGSVAEVYARNNNIRFTSLTGEQEEQLILDDPEAIEPYMMTKIDDVYYYKITKYEELLYIAKTGGDWLTYNYVLGNDITANEATLTWDEGGNFIAQPEGLYQWTPIDSLTGIFDGAGHTISGLYLNNVGQAGFLTNLKGTVKNLNISNSYIKGYQYVGGVVGYTTYSIQDCSFSGAVVGGQYVGGVIGYGYTSISCVNNADVWGSIGNVGGVIGRGNSRDCTNYGNVSCLGNYAGGISGTSGDIKNNINYGNVSGKDYVGGIIPESTYSYAGSYNGNSGNITGNNYVGGIAGSLNSSSSSGYDGVSYSYNLGSITGNEHVGGLIGYQNNYMIIKSYSVGNVAGNRYVGALIGESNHIWGRGSISACYYLKNDVVNSGLNAFGGLEDEEGQGEAGSDEIFPVCMDENADPAYKYLRIPHTITFDVNGGDELPEAQRTKQVIACDPYGVLPTPTYGTTYGFDGWYNGRYSDSVLVTADTNATGEDHTLYAHWHWHNWNSSGEITKNPTVDEEGVRTYTCSVCGATKNEAIGKLRNIADASIEYGPEKSYTYTGNAITPPVELVYKTDDGNWGLGRDYHYTVEYKNNTNPGTASIIITGKGYYPDRHINNCYGGTLVINFQICFKDVPANHNFSKAVYWAVDNGIAAGYTGAKAGTFGVGDNVTRGQVAMFLWRAAGKPEPKKNTQTFKDVPTSHSFYKAIQWANEQGIAGGYSGAKKGYFGPSDNCTRGQIAMFLWRAAHSPAPKTTKQKFSDVPSSNNFFKAVQWAAENGITAGYSDGTFGVNKTCTRGHCVTFLYRMSQKGFLGN